MVRGGLGGVPGPGRGVRPALHAVPGGGGGRGGGILPLARPARAEHARPDAAPPGERGRGPALVHRRERGRARPRRAAGADRAGAALFRLRHQRGRGRDGTGGPVSTERYDVVVVGAGPAGSVAALVLARGGARVALADKAAFPRDKACGDLIGPRGVQVLAELGVRVPDAGQGSDLLAVGPSGRSSKLPAFPGRSYADHGVVVPRLVFDNALREAAVAAGAVPVQARITGVDADGDGTVRAVVASDGRRLDAGVFIGADGALSPLARLAGMLDPDTALWGFAIRAYLPAEVPLPLLVLLDVSPWRIYPGYGGLFPGADGQANVGIGVGLGTSRRQAPLRDDLAKFCALLARRGDIGPDARPGPVTGGWLRMGGTGTPPAAGDRKSTRLNSSHMSISYAVF